MENPTAIKPRRLPRSIAIAAAVTLAAVALLYTLGGFVLLPWYAQRELPRLVERQLQRHAQVGEVSFNPFTLTLEARDFALKEKDGRLLIAFKHAVIDIEWQSLARRAVVFGEIRLDAPVMAIVISPEGYLNLAALAGDQSAAPREPGPSASPHVVIADLQIDRGTIAFDDQRIGYKNQFNDLAVKLSSLSTFADNKGPYVLSARTPGGATLKWKGEVSISPLVATGTIALEHGALPELQPFVKDFLNGAITDGRANVELPYHFALPEGKPRIEVKNGKLSIEAFAITATGADAPLFRFDTFAVEDITLDLAAHTASLGALRLDGLDIKARRDERGEIDLARLLIPRKQDTPSAPWQIAVATIELTKGAVELDDRGIGINRKLNDLALKLGDVTGDFSRSVAFEASAAIAGGGTLSARGRVAPGGVVDAQIDGAAIALAPLQPLIARHANATLAAGEAAFSGTIKSGQKNAALVYSGGASVTNVQVNDPTGVPLVGWKSLATTTLRAQIATIAGMQSLATTRLREQLVPTQLHIDNLHWQEPSGRFAIAADQTSNFRRALKRNDDSKPAEQPAAAPTEAAAATTSTSTDGDDENSGVAIQIRRLDIRQGALDFSDDSLGSGFATSIREFNGTVSGISSDRGTRSQLALEGRVDEYGFARVSGSLNPFLPRDRSNVRVEFRNLDVAKVTPYAVRFAGYKIASGRMSLDLNYRVRNNLIEGDNKILLEQFTLGEKVESPGALNLPLELAIALLKDDDGRIDLALPVTGNLDDPKFDYSAIIGKAIGNMLSGIFLAPFKILARIFSGGQSDEFSNIVFDPGSARLLPPEREKLARIVQALAKRPELKLLVPARYDVELDARAMRRAALRLELGKRAGLDIEAEDPPGPLSIEDRRTRAAVREIFAERFSSAELDKLRAEIEAKSNAADGGKSQQAMSSIEKIGRFASGEPRVADTSEFYRTLGGRLVASQPLAPDALVELARRRAAAIGEALKTAGIDVARVTLTTGDPLNNPEAKNVAMELALSAR